MHRKFKSELKKYLKFLLRFANKEEQFRKTPLYKSKNLEKISLETSRQPLMCIDIGLEKMKNPLDSTSALEDLGAGLQRFKMRIRFLKPPAYVYDISSSPVLDKASDELFSILNSICK